VHRFDVPLAARNRALHYLANESRLSDDIREQLIQVVHGYVGSCDPIAEGHRLDAAALSGFGADAEVLMDELTKAFPNVWCPNCGKVQPMKITVMKANDRNDQDAADILRGERKFVVATLHAEPATLFAWVAA